MSVSIWSNLSTRWHMHWREHALTRSTLTNKMITWHLVFYSKIHVIYLLSLISVNFFYNGLYFSVNHIIGAICHFFFGLNYSRRLEDVQGLCPAECQMWSVATTTCQLWSGSRRMQVMPWRCVQRFWRRTNCQYGQKHNAKQFNN